MSHSTSVVIEEFAAMASTSASTIGLVLVLDL
jgi:hypothetical protein